MVSEVQLWSDRGLMLGWVERVRGWECCGGAVFEDEFQARKCCCCCPPEQVLVWRCELCGELYGFCDDAVLCCGVEGKVSSYDV